MEKQKGFYEKRKKYFEKLSIKQKNTMNFISILRLLIFAAGAGFSIYFFVYKKYYFSISLLFITIVAFIVLILKHNKVIDNRRLTKALYEVNEDSIKRINGEWKDFIDNGEDFKNLDHDYSDDLDIFGKNSLFQWINTAVTPKGRENLKNLLAFPDLALDKILKRQKGIEELSKKISWRQRFNAESKLIPKDKQNIAELISWVKAKEMSVDKNYLKLALIVMPIITVSSIIYYFIKPSISYAIPLIPIALDLLILKLGEKLREEALETSYKYKNNIKVYAKLIKQIEKGRFNSEILNGLKKKLFSKKGINASSSIDKLVKIVDKIQDRRNLFSIILNILFLWDYHLVINLESWKRSYGKDLEQWFEVIGEFEALSSIAIIHYDNSDWTMPQFNNKMIISAKDMAHPLLPKNRISNSINIGEPSTILLITGSNMSGKSTFLRTIGINLVLAYTGAPVCAQSFNSPLMNIYTCMRISDNLEENISSFYAEILRIKKIVNSVKNGRPIFFLLDEIFKGTNSMDRHLGAETLINRLSKENALGLVSTHDLELGDLENKNEKVKNYHFQEHYKNNEIYFDYKLRQGISTTRNAIYLMRMAGIEFND